MRRWMTKAATLVAVWLPMLVMWVILVMIYARISFLEALPRSAITVVTAAILGLAVPPICARMPWPSELRIRFYALHLIAAALYAAAWLFLGFAIDSWYSGSEFWRTITSSARVMGWSFLMGLWLYGVIAGVSYAITMQRQARASERRALQAEANLATARLDALRSRLHPHFLFNALHTVAALVRHEPAQAENAIEKLGDMLRYSLEDTRSETVPFPEEWEFTRRYLEFEQLRYGARLHVASTIDPACMTCSAPTFALQTLVENAVRHSIATRPDGGRIEITARAADDGLHVRVRDDGSNGLPSTHNGAHYGLFALRERLTSIYDGNAQLAISSEPDGFEVSFTVPCTRGIDADDE